ncbi:MAG: OmpA family protein, partial [Saprospiraceae bacterium]|nr:OmpA family protein [Saprospiraceae bacterium]
KMMINLTAEGYIFYSDHIIIDSIAHGMAPFDKTIHLTKIPAPSTFDEGKSFVLKNVFFESGTAELQEISLMEIKKLADILMKNEKLKLKIIGHTDNVGEDYDNKVLSEKRASSVKKALISLGIQQNRLVTEGQGESAPVQDNFTEAGRNQNRRTEFILY